MLPELPCHVSKGVVSGAALVQLTVNNASTVTSAIIVDRHVAIVDGHIDIVDRHIDIVDRHIDIVDRHIDIVDRHIDIVTSTSSHSATSRATEG